MNKQDSFTAADLNKLHEALTATGEKLYGLLHHNDQDIIRTLLKNKALNEEHLLIILKRLDLTEKTITAIYKKNEQLHSHQILLAIARNPATESNILRTILPLLRLFELLDICLLPGASADLKLTAERIILQRIPTAPLGHKITLARRGTPAIVAMLLKEGTGQLVEICLGNPHLKEAAVFQFLRGGTARAETISMIARHERWKQRPNIRLTILKNRKTPEIWFTLWLPKLPQALFIQLLQTLRLQPSRKNLLTAEKRRRGML